MGRSDQATTTGVFLSVPLDSAHHVLDDTPRSDVTRSWSRSEMIAVSPRGRNEWSVAATVFNLGDVDATAHVDLVTWCLLNDGERIVDQVVLAKNLSIAATQPGDLPSSAETPLDQVYHAPENAEVTHF